MTAAPSLAGRVAQVPFFVLMMGIGSAAMILPAAHALAREDFLTARVFFYGAILSGVLTVLIGLAAAGHRAGRVPKSQLATLLMAYTLLPAIFAVPFSEAAQSGSFLDAWFEMVSCFTTTGATVFDGSRIAPSLHLWRATVGWLGGLLVWVTAVAVLAPMNLGGFEVRTAIAQQDGARRFAQITRIADPAERIVRYGMQLAPIYTGLTALLWIGLIVVGEVPIVAISHAMSILATSGISPVGGAHGGAGGIPGEMLMFLFLIFALSRITFSRGLFSGESGKIRRDPEISMGLALVVIVPALLFMRHFLGAVEERTEADLPNALSALWGSVFTVLSFLTTTGFESARWVGARNWSGLETPGLILVGLSLVGGGVATTAGGVKLLRVYALYKHGVRELERLVHPHSVGGAGAEARRIRRQGAYISWLFFMLFALSITVVMLLLSLSGVQFESAMVLAVSALSTTGPLAEVAAETPILYSDVPDMAKAVLAATMVLGRLETLALIALLNPESWRN